MTPAPHDVALIELLTRTVVRLGIADSITLRHALSESVNAFNGGVDAWELCANAPAMVERASLAVGEKRVVRALLSAQTRTALLRHARAARVQNARTCSVVEAQLLLLSAVAEEQGNGKAGQEPSVSAPPPGTVFWICGLSGSGKTTLSGYLRTALRARGRECATLDGDSLRVMIAGTPVYSISERRMMALSYAELSRHIYRAGTDVLCSAISPFADLRERNRVAFPRYCEILLDTPTDILRTRDRKGVYENANGVGCSNVVGVDQQFEQSVSPPHYVVSNRGGKKQLRQAAEQIAAARSRGASESP